MAIPAVGVAACGGGSTSTTANGGSAASCAAVVVRDETSFLGWRVPHPERLPPHAGRARAHVPPCYDTNVDGQRQGTRGTTIPVETFRGVSAEVAFARTAGSAEVYVREGSLAVVPSHPLHAALYGSAKRPRGRQARCHARFAATGRAKAPAGPARIEVVTAAGSVAHVTLDAATRVSGRQFHRTFVVSKGTEVRIAGRRCRSQPLVVTATRVTVGRRR